MTFLNKRSKRLLFFQNISVKNHLYTDMHNYIRVTRTFLSAECLNNIYFYYSIKLFFFINYQDRNSGRKCFCFNYVYYIAFGMCSDTIKSVVIPTLEQATYYIIQHWMWKTIWKKLHFPKLVHTLVATVFEFCWWSLQMQVAPEAAKFEFE